MEINLPKKEEEILKLWEKDKVFEKSLASRKGRPRFVFFEGPPFANGLPGIHHLLVRAFKDVILRYKTMQGFLVERKAGWDTHGLPTEISAEKKLMINSKKEIEKNVKGFIDECKNNVFTYKKEWEEFTQRIGYWLDLKNAYLTCSNEYIESLWWILKNIWEKGLLYQDYKVVPYCPRCGTSLSSHEVAQGYKTIKEKSIYLKFKVKDEKDSYFLVWTTTPWTLPGNVAIAFNPNLEYVRVKSENQHLYLAKSRLAVLEDYKIEKELKGKDLARMEYEPLYDFTKPSKKAYFLVSGDFVSGQDGTGFVHIAPAFGEDDMTVGQKNDLPVIVNVDDEGKFTKEVKPWAGQFVKDADQGIIDDLKSRGLFFKEEMYEHEYPFCWRCDSPLLYYAKQSWFIKTTAIKEKLIQNNKKVNWIPEYLKEGRFGEWLNDVKDWNLSRERYWGTPLPVWQCQECKKQVCISSLKELKEKSLSSLNIKNLHKPEIDEVVLKCECGGKMFRVKEVIDCWFDAGSMPFAQWHYPFENKDLIDKKEFFPADFICEAVDQTRGWFYTLLVVSTMLGFEAPYKNVVSTGLVLDEKSRKMSKSKGNVVVPSDIINKYGADVARFYFYTVNSVGDPKKFSFKDVQTLYRKFFDTLLNSQKFFELYASDLKIKEEFNSKNLLDRWIVSCLETLNQKTIENLDKYDIVSAARGFEVFVDDLSNWYIRRSRKRLQKQEKDKEKEEAAQTLSYVLLKLTRLLAPFTPFLSESLYQALGQKQSVHLEEYPLPNKKLIDVGLEEEMMAVREAVNLGLKERASLGIKVRQPLSRISLKRKKLNKELEELIRDEVNVKEVVFNEKIENEAELDARITPELKNEGIIREIIHQVQEMRKRSGLKPKDEIKISFSGDSGLEKMLRNNKKAILKEGRIKDLKIGELKEAFDSEETIKVEGQELKISIKKI